MTMNKHDLDRINSMTKYPSISTYHAIDPQNGNLLEDAVEFSGEVIVTEKIDGANARLIAFPNGGFMIASRTELLYAEGDILANPVYQIVSTLEDWAYDLDLKNMIDDPTVIYMEVFGGTIGKHFNQYTTERATDFRIFDIAEIPGKEFDSMLDWELDRIASWRDNGGQKFLTEDQLVGRAATGGLKAPLTPRLLRIDGSELPRSVSDTAVWMKNNLDSTNVAIDERAGGSAEGMVFRSQDRSVIAKARFEDYNRTLRRRAQNGK